MPPGEEGNSWNWRDRLAELVLPFAAAVLTALGAASMNASAVGATADALQTPRNPEIFVVPAKGGRARNLTRNPARDDEPALAPDGRRLVFIRTLQDGESGLWMMNTDGTHQRRLTDATCPGQQSWSKPSWSPDGSRIAFYCRNYASGRYVPALGIFALASGELRWIADASDPTWSPDGRRLAFLTDYGEGFREGPYSIAVANADGSDRRVVARASDFKAYRFLSPHWSPNGSLIAFSVYNGGLPLYVVDVDDPSTVRQVAPFGYDATWSPDGGRLAFRVDTTGTRSSAPGGIWSVGADGLRLRRLVSGKKYRKARNAEWSPNGNRLAFVSGTRASGGKLLVANADGRLPHLIAKPVQGDRHPIWSRDGRKLLYVE